MKVLEYIAADASKISPLNGGLSDPGTVYVQYINTGTSGGTNTIRVTAGGTLTGNGTATGQTLNVQTTNTAGVNPAVEQDTSSIAA